MSKADRTKEYIIKNIATIFNTKGYAGTSLNDMTEATGLTKGSIYGNFINKDDVALEAFKFNLEIMSRLFSSEIEKRKTFKEKLMVYPDVIKNSFNTSFPKGGCPILNTAIESDDTHPILKHQTALAFIKWKNKIESLIKDGIASNEFKVNTSPEQAAFTILAMLEGGIMIKKLTDKQEYVEMVMDSLYDFINSL